MTFSTTYTQPITYTIVHARHMAAKVKTDLKRIQRLYDQPTDWLIDAYETEAIALLNAGYLKVVTYGFQRAGEWIEPSVTYTAQELAGSTGRDDDPGKIRPSANVTGAHFSSFLEYTSAWFSLQEHQQENFMKQLPFRRSYGDDPAVNGYRVADLTYSAGGRSLNRSYVRSF